MRFPSWLRALTARFSRVPTPQTRRRPTFRPRLEALEDRVVPATFMVTNTLDDGSAGSLRYEVAQANASGDPTNTIDFDLGAGAHTITLTNGPLSLTNTNATTIIEGSGTADQLAISGNNATQVFNIASGATVELDDLTITKGSGDYGGGIYNQGNLTIKDSTLADNTATYYGGGLFNDQGTAIVSNSTLADNTADIGGGIANYGTVTINNSTLADNTARVGGGIDNEYGHTVTVNNSTLTDNTANYGGGGIFNYYGTITLSNSTLTDNTAAYYGGGIYNAYFSTATLSNSTLADNTAGEGGGIFNDQGTATVSNSTLADNTATGGSGGGIYNRGTVTLSNSTLAANTAGNGGGIDNNAGTATITISNSTLADNTATVSGGGILNFGTATISNSTLADNTATYYAGGILNFGTATLSNSIVATNKAPYGGTDLYGSFTSRGHNLIGVEDGYASGFTNGSNGDIVGTAANPVDPKLGSLADNGGPTQTMALLAGSPALNAGSNDLIPIDPGTGLPYTTDQRGSPRIFDSIVDIGAYEAQQASQSIMFGALANKTYGDSDFALTATASSGLLVSYSATGVARVYQDSNGNWFAHITGVGSATITATQAGNSDFFAATPVSQPFTVNPAPLSATAVNFNATAGAPFGGTVATFTNADPFGSAASYTAVITWGDGSTSSGVISGTGNTLTVSGSHTFADPVNKTVTVQISHNLGYTTTATVSDTATVVNLGQGVRSGQGLAVGSWHSKSGQALINAFNGGSSSTALGTWLANTFPNLYGANAGTNNLTGKTNAQVAAFYLTLFKQSGTKLDAQVLATALNVYATTLSLGGTAGQSYGFLVNANGLGAYSYNVGSNGPAFGVPNNTTLNVYEILLAANQQAQNGVLYNGNATLDTEAKNVFSGINQAGGI